MTSTRTVVVEGHPRPNSMSSMEMREMKGSQFLSRTSMFFKKVTLFPRSGTPRRKSEERRGSSTALPRSARSMDVGMGMGNKMYGMSQPVLSVNASMTDNEDHSDASGSPTQSGSRPTSSLPPPHSAHPLLPTQTTAHAVRSPPPSGLPPMDLGPAKLEIDGLPPSESPVGQQTANGSSTNPFRNLIDTSGGPVASSSAESGMTETSSNESFHSAPENISTTAAQPTVPSSTNPFLQKSPVPAPAAADAPVAQPMKFNPSTPLHQHVFMDGSPDARTQSLPSRNIASPHATPSIPNGSPAPSVTPAPSTSDAPTPKPMHPRLASLPPPMMARYATQGSTRLTPSIMQRPMPILNLPTLPPPTPTQPPPSAAQMSSPMRLRSMPALPMRGPSEVHTADADHDSAALDEMDEMMEEEEEEVSAEHVSEDEEDTASSPSIEIPTPGRRLRGPLPPSLSRSPRVPDLPEVDTSRLDISFRTPTPNAAASSSAVPAGEANRITVYFTPTEPIPPVDILGTPIQPFRKPAASTPGGTTTDYFTSKAPEASTRTPRPADYEHLPVPKTVPMPHASPRPGLYNQASKSMVDLLSAARKDKTPELGPSENRKSGVPDYATANTRDTPHTPAGSKESSQGPPLRRQRSLPMFNPSSEPPPYPSFMHTPPRNLMPREEEGREKLPPYTNSIYLAAIMPRKMEFVAPGFQSKDRKWKRALCILEGTALKIYRVHNGVVEDWWERTVGVGDKTSVDPLATGPSGAIRVSGVRESERRVDPPKGEALEGSPSPAASAPTASPASSSSAAPASSTTSPTPCSSGPQPSRSKLHSLLHPRSHRNDKLPPCSSSASNSRMSFDMGRDEPRSSSSTAPRRQSMDSARTTSPSTSTSALSSRPTRQSSDDTSASSTRSPTSSSLSRRPTGQAPAPAVSHFSMLSSSEHMPIPEPDPKDLLRKYSLQHAESGLASDYTKRKNVIRVRMEGEQFLLQARDVPAVIEWIEGIQAATNIALDLDERPMPRGPMFPRRRRRRPRRPEGEAQGTSNSTPRPGQAS